MNEIDHMACRTSALTVTGLIACRCQFVSANFGNVDTSISGQKIRCSMASTWWQSATEIPTSHDRRVCLYPVLGFGRPRSTMRPKCPGSIIVTPNLDSKVIICTALTMNMMSRHGDDNHTTTRILSSARCFAELLRKMKWWAFEP